MEAEASRTLWVGDLDNWMDEAFLGRMFAHVAMQIVNVKLIREKGSQFTIGYGFVEFINHQTAQQVMDLYNGQNIPEYPSKKYRLNWAQFGITEKRPDTAVFSIFVGDLAADVNDSLLEATFKANYPSVVNARVVVDSSTGKPKGYGFVRFSDETECQRAIAEMNNVYLLTRPMRINSATPKKGAASNTPLDIPSSNQQQQQQQQAAANQVPPGDPNCTTVFIGNLSSNVGADELRSKFASFGDIASIKIPPGKSCGFVQFFSHQSAAAAIETLQGSQIGQHRVRLSWGKPNPPPVQAMQSLQSVKAMPAAPMMMSHVNQMAMQPTVAYAAAQYPSYAAPNQWGYNYAAAPTYQAYASYPMQVGSAPTAVAAYPSQQMHEVAAPTAMTAIPTALSAAPAAVATITYDYPRTVDKKNAMYIEQHAPQYYLGYIDSRTQYHHHQQQQPPSDHM